MAGALFLCSPTSGGAGRVQGGGVDVGRGVGLGVGAGVGVGTGVGWGVCAGVASGVATAPADGKTTASLGTEDSLAEADETAPDDPLGAPATTPDEEGEGERTGDDVATVAGVPTAPATPAAGRNGFPMMSAAATATETTDASATCDRPAGRS